MKKVIRPVDCEEMLEFVLDKIKDAYDTGTLTMESTVDLIENKDNTISTGDYHMHLTYRKPKDES